MSTSGNTALWASSSIMHRHFSSNRELHFQHSTLQTIEPQANKLEKPCTIMIFLHFMSHTIAWAEGFQLTRTIVKTVICKQTGRNLVWFTVLLALPAFPSPPDRLSIQVFLHWRFERFRFYTSAIFIASLGVHNTRFSISLGLRVGIVRGLMRVGGIKSQITLTQQKILERTWTRGHVPLAASVIGRQPRGS